MPRVESGALLLPDQSAVDPLFVCEVASADPQPYDAPEQFVVAEERLLADDIWADIILEAVRTISAEVMA